MSTAVNCAQRGPPGQSYRPDEPEPPRACPAWHAVAPPPSPALPSAGRAPAPAGPCSTHSTKEGLDLELDY